MQEITIRAQRENNNLYLAKLCKRDDLLTVSCKMGRFGHGMMNRWVDEQIQKRDNTDSLRDRAKKIMVGEWRAEFSCMADFY